MYFGYSVGDYVNDKVLMFGILFVYRLLIIFV